MKGICRLEEVRLRRTCIRKSNSHTALAVRTLATSRGRCHGVNDENLRRGAGGGSPFSFFAQESQKRGTAKG